MAIRYSGDTEVRFRWDADRRLFVGSVKDPFLHWEGEHRGSKKPKDSDDYDAAAYALFGKASAWAREKGARFQADVSGGKVRFRRVFQAPCPLPEIKRVQRATRSDTRRR